MSIDATVAKTAEGSWLFTWPVGTSPYQVWLNGEQLENALTTESYDFRGVGYEDLAPPLEILNDGDSVENTLYPPRFTLQWRGIQTASGYAVQQWLSAAWVEVANITERGEGYYLWTSDSVEGLEDQATHLFRVIALNLAGSEGTPLAFTSDITRNPHTPDVAFAITAGDVVVSAA